MKSIVAALVVVGLVAAPGFGVINLTLKGRVGTSGTFSSNVSTVGKVGQTLTVQLWGQGTTSGLLAVGGDIVASGDTSLGTPTQMKWTAKTVPDPDLIHVMVFVNGGFSGAGFKTILADTDGDGLNDTLVGYEFATSAFPAGRPSPVTINNYMMGGTPGANGAMARLGSGQAPGASLDASFGKSAPVLLGSYTVPIVSEGVTWLTWVEAPLAGTTHVGYGGWYTVGTTAGDWTIGTITPLAINVPEPATMALLALGGLLLARRRA